MRTLLMVVVGISAITSMTQLRGEDPKPLAQKVGVTSSELFLGAVPRAGDTEVTVLDVTYLPGAINPRALSPGGGDLPCHFRYAGVPGGRTRRR